MAIAKSEAGTTKQIDQIGVLLTSAVTGISDKIDDLKERIASTENRIIAAESRGKGMGDGWGYLVGALGLIALLVTAVGSVVILFARH